MNISIKAKLSAVACLAVISFMLVTAIIYRDNIELAELNERTFNNQANKILVDKWRATSLRLKGEYYKAVSERATGKIDPTMYDEMKQIAGSLGDFPDRYINKHVDYLNKEHLLSAEEESNKISDLVANDL